jgi:hypothetical protein
MAAQAISRARLRILLACTHKCMLQQAAYNCKRFDTSCNQRFFITETCPKRARISSENVNPASCRPDVRRQTPPHRRDQR